MRGAPLQNLLQEEEAEINITPMLDVVFIMLIFFIVTASFVKEAGIDVNRPEAATAVKKERANILIAISDKGEIWINKRRIDVRACISLSSYKWNKMQSCAFIKRKFFLCESPKIKIK